MREICQSGSEGGGGYSLPTPIVAGKCGYFRGIGPLVPAVIDFAAIV